jgi:hypothetical protein
MPIVATGWRNFIDGSTVLVGGEPWPWQFGSDDVVPIDLADVLDDGETITNPVATLRKIPAFGESDYVAASDKITSTTISGTAVLVRLAALEQGRYYKLDVLTGAAGNRRGGNTIIRVSG